MTGNPIENNPVTRFILGFAVIAAMMLGANAGAHLAPGSGGSVLVGVVLGALVPFAVFAWWYTRYDASVDQS